MILMSKKHLIYIILLGSFFLFWFNLDAIRATAVSYLNEDQKQKISEIFFGKGTADLFKKYKIYGKMNYNQNLLPATQYMHINFKHFLLKNVKMYASKSKWNPSLVQFFLEQFDEYIIISDSKANIFYINKEFINDFENFSWIKLESNFKFESENGSIRDLFVYNNEIFISYSDYQIKDCTKLNILKATISKEKLNFKTFFKTKDCGPDLDAGRMSYYNHYGKEGLLVTTSTGIEGDEAQDNNSSFGKILFIDFENKDSIIFSKGHRTPQGLSVENDLILSAEHGPRGGDEINLIEFGNNYGWPISSYGEPYYEEEFYKTENSKNSFFYHKNHSDYGFTEPVYAFVPSIGINQIIKVPDSFSIFWKNNYLVTSLNRGSVYRIQLDKNFNKLISREEIFIGKRIRDIIYVDGFNVFLLALEGSEYSKVDEAIPNVGILQNVSN